MRTESSFSHSTIFTGPSNPAALCLQLIRLKQPVTRTFLVDHSPHSQPTITRAVLGLMGAQLVRERPDKIMPIGPGRPKIPLELTPSPWVHVGMAIGTKSTYLGVYGTRGQLLREQFVEISPAEHSVQNFVNEMVPHIIRMVSDSKLPLANLGISTSGIVDDHSLITAANLGWDHADIVNPLHQALDVPITIASVIEAIAGAEQHTQIPPKPAPKPRPNQKRLPKVPKVHEHRGLIFYVDDSIGAAVHTYNSVKLLEVGNYTSVEAAAMDLASKTSPDTIVLAGSAFENSADAHAVGRALRASKHANVEIRVIPTHIDNARAAARSVALSGLLTDPINFAKQIVTGSSQYAI
ncbi:ROK family protein [Corynebacterium mustelae]|uniref:ROK family protein n=1 Tax=Corynebacterium mustelae TaxID=571915 RepID=A0A0G3H014_9CORY|nr:ROK family protein [Corynebacterium mustelae]AKK04447.1 ROK family protein [Corynebacterium mustelae]